ncbi:response regulator [Aphanothece hegewaldii CCALA 016]|uniref:Response regulator n=1 Tax=Aphanothece hegewaldii CCALA 016 TaxID=2107694 RepID=A0A2T1LTG9_9CHRO|nr:response regulator [Aphanothece hegewaldii]PSF34230.1 response regulator [Aphanothece hegewaldii CCALA 016]
MSWILIVEDEARIAAFLEKGLRKNGYNTAIATDGEQALELSYRQNFDLLLLDLGLPIKDGWTVLQELRHQGKLMPVIVVTARDDIDPQSYPIQDYIIKPFRFQNLLEKIRKYLKNHTSRNFENE